MALRHTLYREDHCRPPLAEKGKMGKEPDGAGDITMQRKQEES